MLDHFGVPSIRGGIRYYKLLSPLEHINNMANFPDSVLPFFLGSKKNKEPAAPGDNRQYAGL